MRWLSVILLTALAAPAAAQSQWFTADVVRTEGRWTASGSHIVTDATLRTTDGRELVVSQLGGTAGGYGQIVWHGQPELRPGMRVRVAAHPHDAVSPWIVDDVIVDRLGTAAPFVRTVTKKSGVRLYWAKSCIEVKRSASGTRAIDREDAIITEAIAAWNDGIGGCSYLNLVDLGTDTREVGGRDRVNLIIIRDEEWCRPPVDGEAKRCFSGNAAGVTTVTYVDDPDDDRDGEIIDADVELNNVTFRMTDGGQGTGSPQLCDAELSNTLVHELGHLLGLEHTCRAIGDPPRVDHTGASVPLCSETTDPLVVEATMFPFQDCGETKKATPEADDVAALCTTYPSADDPGVCEAPDELTGGCCDAGGAPPTGSALALLLFVLVSARPRRSAPRRWPARP